MRRALAWTAGIVGVAALLRWLRRQSREERAPQEQRLADPAAELRRTIEDARAAAPAPADEAEAEAEPEPDASVEDRRAAVHARGEDAIARMRGPSDAP